jgi:hypothetical protein
MAPGHGFRPGCLQNPLHDGGLLGVVEGDLRRSGKETAIVAGHPEFAQRFHNLLCERLQPEVLIDDFHSTSFEFTNRARVNHLLENVSHFAIDQSWGHFAKLAGQMMMDGVRGKDF